MAERTVRGRRTLFLAALLLGAFVLAAWTVRAFVPRRPGPDEAASRHWVPLPGDDLFTLELPKDAADRYDVVADIDCLAEDGRPVTQLGPDQAMACGDGLARTRFRLDTTSPRHRLVLDGLTVDIPSDASGTLGTVGLGRDADVVLHVPGVGVEHLVLTAPCVDDALFCVENGGLRGSLVVDSSERLRTDDGRVPAGDRAPLLRVAPTHGEAAPVRDGDRIWAGQVPLLVERVRVDLDGATQVRLRIEDGADDERTFTQVAGDRRWMGLELPSWPLATLSTTDAGWEITGPRRFRFHSREQLFRSSPWPWVWRSHLADHRVEFELEERLQAYIDHELLCFDSAYDPHAPPPEHAPFPASFRWNLDTGVGCDGASIAPPPPDLYRAAEEQAHDRETTDKLRRAAAALTDLPDEVPAPGELGFVYDWARVAGSDEDLALVPTRLLGVRPLSTRSGPTRDRAVPEDEDTCQLAESGHARPPIDARAGSTSPVVTLEDGPRLLVVAPGTVCVGPTLPGDIVDAGTLPLGHVSLRGGTWRWSGAAQLGLEAATCARFEPGEQGVWVAREGPGELLLTAVSTDADTLVDLEDGVATQLSDGDRLTLVSGDVELAMTLSDPQRPDRLAASVVRDDRVVRTYPFGADAAGLLGVEGLVHGGLESWIEPSVWEQAGETWEDTCEEPEETGVSLTLSGDLQRIVYGEVAAVLAETEPAGNAEEITAQVVLMDGETGDLLAVVNAPGFDPNDRDGLRELQSRLKKRDGHWRAPATLDNLAFRRSKGAGSVYKLATSYALARGGLLTPARPALDDTSCVRMRFAELEVDDQGTATLLPQSPLAVRSGKTVRCSDDDGRIQTFHAGSASRGFHDAFRKSKNPYFALGSIALIPTAGVGYGPSSTRMPETAGGLWRTGGDLIVVLDPAFSFERDLGGGNVFFDTLVQVGHRTHYKLAFHSQDKDSVNGLAFPTVGDRRWLPGLRVGGFVYPSIEGPEIYGVDDGVTRTLDLTYTRAGQTSTVQRTVGVTHVANYARASYGLGGVQASALSLAVMASPMARDDHAVVSPDLLTAAGARVGEPLLDDTSAATIETAMRAVVGASGSTATRYFAGSPIQDRVGGKTGTFSTQAATRPAPETQGGVARERIRAWGCGQVGATFHREDWVTLTSSLETAHGWRRAGRTLDERPYIDDLVGRVVAGETPPHGFAAGAASCDAVNPNRAGVSADVGDEHTLDGGVWLDELMGLFPDPPSDVVLVPGTSFVAVAFDGLADGPTGPLGEGWVLAVVVDGHDTASKRIAVRVLERTAQYLEIRGAE